MPKQKTNGSCRQRHTSKHGPASDYQGRLRTRPSGSLVASNLYNQTASNNVQLPTNECGNASSVFSDPMPTDSVSTRLKSSAVPAQSADQPSSSTDGAIADSQPSTECQPVNSDAVKCEDVASSLLVADSNEGDVRSKDKGVECRAQSEFMCPICYDILVNAVRSSCEHVFCRLCLLRWGVAHRGCPVCRQRAEIIIPAGEINSTLDSLYRQASESMQRGRRAAVRARRQEEDEFEGHVMEFNRSGHWDADSQRLVLHVTLAPISLLPPFQDRFAAMMEGFRRETIARRGQRFNVIVTITGTGLTGNITAAARTGHHGQAASGSERS